MSINPVPSQVITYIDNMSPEMADREERENDYILQREAFLDALRETGDGGGSGFSPANILYVAKNGNDSNDGTFGKPFLTIQTAINAANSVVDDANRIVIFVFPGTYTEQLTFTKGDIALYGADPNSTLVEYSSGDVVTVDGTGYIAVTLANFLIYNGGDGVGVKVNGGTVVTLEGISIGTTNDEACIVNSNSFTLAVNETAFSSNNKNGCSVTGGANGYFSNCSFYGNAPTFYDLFVDAESGLIIGNNLFQNNNVSLLGNITYGNKASQIGNDSNVSGITVKDALNTLNSGGSSITFKRDIFPPATLNQTEFTLTATPALNSETVNVNGLIAYPGSNNDYVLSGDTITFNYGLEPNDKVMASYN